MDHTLIGPAYEVKFPYRISGEAQDNPDLVKVEGNHIVFVKDIAPRKIFISRISGNITMG